MSVPDPLAEAMLMVRWPDGSYMDLPSRRVCGMLADAARAHIAAVLTDEATVEAVVRDHYARYEWSGCAGPMWSLLPVDVHDRYRADVRRTLAVVAERLGVEL